MSREKRALLTVMQHGLLISPFVGNDLGDKFRIVCLGIRA